MRKLCMGLLAASLLGAPAQAAGLDAASEVRLGAFVGARLQLPLGYANGHRPRAALAIAPTRSQISDSGTIRTAIGEGVAFNLSPGRKPTVTLAGVRADVALGFERQRPVDAENGMGISTGGWIGIGVGTVALALGGLYLWADHISDCEERENGC